MAGGRAGGTVIVDTQVVSTSPSPSCTGHLQSTVVFWSLSEGTFTSVEFHIFALCMKIRTVAVIYII